MTYIDSHQHFWDPNKLAYDWMAPDVLAPIRKVITPADLAPLIAAKDVSRTIVVQAIPSAQETRDFLDIAMATDFVAGVVGWVDLCAPDVADTIAALKAGPGGEFLVGIRHQIHDEPDADWPRREDVKAGVRAVGQAGLVYDLLSRERELAACIDLVAACPDVQFVMNHISKPRISSGEMEPWGPLMAQLASFDNVACKLSGMITEANWDSWTIDDLRPYATEVLRLFGPDRVMFGSDWPVCNLAGEYGRVFDAAMSIVRDAAPNAVDAVFAGNAARIYKLPG